MTGWDYRFKYNRAQEQRGLIEGHFPVFDVGPVERKCPVRSSFIFSCHSRACKCGNKGKKIIWTAEVNSSQLE